MVGIEKKISGGFTGVHSDGWSAGTPILPYQLTLLQFKSVLTSLVVLDLSWHPLRGETSEDGYANLTLLVPLDLSFNCFNGSILGEIFQLKNLEYLGLSGNLLVGQLNAKDGDLVLLTLLNLDQNSFSRMIPEEFGQLTQVLTLLTAHTLHIGTQLSKRFGYVPIFERLAWLLRKEVGFLVQMQALHLLFLLLNCPRLLMMFSDEHKDVHPVAGSVGGKRSAVLQGKIVRILEGLPECLACKGSGPQEIKLSRHAITVLASSRKRGFVILLNLHSSIDRMHFLQLGLIIYIKDGSLDLPLRWLRFMGSSGIRTNNFIIRQLLESCMHSGLYESAKPLLETYVSSAAEVALILYTSILAHLVRCQDAQNESTIMEILSPPQHKAPSFMCGLFTGTAPNKKSVLSFVREFFHGLEYVLEDSAAKYFVNLLLNYLVLMGQINRARCVWKVAYANKLFPKAIVFNQHLAWSLDVQRLSVGAALVAVELHGLNREGISADNISTHLSPWAFALIDFLPSFIKHQLLLHPKSDDSAQLSHIQTEKLLAQLVQTEMTKRLKVGTYMGKNFNAIYHFFGYQARGSFPFPFDCDFASILGHISYHILAAGLNGYIAIVTNLQHPVNKWRCGAAPIMARMTATQWSCGPKATSLGQPAVHPSDSVAILAANAVQAIPYFASGLKGVARSMPTSAALDVVATTLHLKFFEVPTGSKFFGNLLAVGLCPICGEEDFGTGSDHIHAKDDIWAVLAWLSILAFKPKENLRGETLVTVEDSVREHWSNYGRHHYTRYGYKTVAAGGATELLATLIKLHVEGICTGTSSVVEARQVSFIFRYAFSVQPLPVEMRPPENPFSVASGAGSLSNMTVQHKLETNSVVALYFQIAPDVGLAATRLRAIADLFDEISEAQFFNQLRTKEQLGYPVQSGTRITYRVLGFCFLAHSSDYAPIYLHEIFNRFISSLHALLEGFDAESFENSRAPLIEQKLEKHPSLIAETDHPWTQLVDKRYFYDMLQLDADASREVLVWWTHTNATAATWAAIAVFQHAYPDFELEDKLYLT